MMRKGFILVLIMLTSITSGCGIYLGASPTGTEIMEEHSIEGMKEVGIELTSDNVEIITHDKNTIVATLTTFAEGPKLSVTQENQSMIIKVEDGTDSYLAAVGRMPRLQIKLPASYQESVEITSKSGNTLLNQSSLNQVTVNTKSGNITTENSNIKHFTARTTSGSISTRNDQFMGTYDLQSNSGNIDMSIVNKQLDATIHAETNSGKLSVSLPFELEKMEEDLIVGRDGDGTHSIKLKTGSGNISIK
ncbi:DUF4097 family beta strand repeat-containing protein [Brevibacillus daliensis]|uniref:DUF4097 family beta strand repeat-containing protein n=1 Tax=Brevibacillus daliensis TaxID=2892995 RepID=UPI001E527868|nr:DUF4097 family beta strand repeat-containing protein [Brevibacillus daliensis]